MRRNLLRYTSLSILWLLGQYTCTVVLLAAASDIVAHASRLAVSAGWVAGWVAGCARALPPRFYVAHSAVSIPCNIYIYISTIYIYRPHIYIDHIYIYRCDAAKCSTVVVVVVPVLSLP